MELKKPERRRVSVQKRVTGMTVQELAQELRRRLVRKKTWEQVGMCESAFIYLLNDHTDEAIIDSYITCPQCGTRNLALEEALLLASKCESVKTWLLRTSGHGHHVH